MRSSWRSTRIRRTPSPTPPPSGPSIRRKTCSRKLNASPTRDGRVRLAGAQRLQKLALVSERRILLVHLEDLAFRRDHHINRKRGDLRQLLLELKVRLVLLGLAVREQFYEDELAHLAGNRLS